MITYNHEPYIAQAIEGVLMQKTDFPIELVIGEDCSTDGTRKIVLEYQRQHPEVSRVITSQHNVGMMLNSFRTQMACRGDYVAFCEGDDYWTDPHKLQKQVDFLERNPEFAICGHLVTNVDASGNLLDEQVYTGEDCPEVFGVEHVLAGAPVHTGSWVLRRTAISTALCSNRNVYVSLPAGDNPLLLMTLMKGKGYCMKDYMGAYRIHAGGVYRSKADLFRRCDAVLFNYAIPILLGEDSTPAIELKVKQLTIRSEKMLADAIGRSPNPTAVTRLLRVMRTSGLVPRGRIPAILLRVPFIQVQRFYEYLKTLLPPAWRSRLGSYRIMMAGWMTKRA